MRPEYETKEQKAAESRMLYRLSEIGNYSKIVQVTKRFYPFDAIAYREEVAAAFLEVKIRTNHSTAYPTYMISLKKFTDGTLMSEICDTLYVIAVRWVDCIGTWRHRGERLSISMGGRTDRQDQDDIEPVIHIPITQFNRHKL